MIIDDGYLEKEDTINEWYNGFRTIELAFEKENIKDGIKEVLEMIESFTGAKEVNAYKIVGDINKSDSYVNLTNNNRNILSFYDNGKLKPRTNKIKITTKENTYIIIIYKNNIIDEKNNNKYLSIIQRALKIIFDKMDLEDKINKAVVTDGLTNIGNRYYYNKFIDEISKYKKEVFTYTLIDLFRLKYINDNYGHKSGDEYILLASNLMKEVLGKDNYLFRIGGDEFAIISVGRKKEQIEEMIEKINDILVEKSNIMNLPFPLCLNYGIVEGNNFDVMYMESDEKMSEHKKQTYIKLNIDRRK